VREYGAKLDPAGAQAQARRFIARYPNARKLRLMLAAQLADRGNYPAALAELQAMSRRAPEDFDLLLMRAQLAYKAGQLPLSRSLLEQYLEVQIQRQRALLPGTNDAAAAVADAYVLLAQIAEDQGRYEDAVADLGRIHESALRYPILIRQALLRAKQGRVDDALTMIDAANPQDDEERIQGVLAKAQVLREANRLAQAVTMLEATDQAIIDSVEIKYELAMVYERQNRLAQLERVLRQIMVLDPNHAHAYNALGYTLADHNLRLPEALGLITQALELAPNDPLILDSMGWVKFRMGDYATASEYLARAYAQRPEPDIAAHLAEVFWAQGKRQQALELLQGALKNHPQHTALLEIAKRLGVAQ
jgi:tetratricopeptide (TPR) repeat protein